jgi:anti-sigma factor RsiW
MNEHVLDWIAAYYDGELHGDRLRAVETHLQGCAACRAELEALGALGARLQASPPMPARTPPEQFVAQVRLRLPERSAPTAGRARLRRAASLWLPLAVLALWALGQAVLAVGGLLLTWLGTRMNTFIGPVELLVLNLALTGVAAGLIVGCLASWWAAREKEVGDNPRWLSSRPPEAAGN